MALQEIFVLWPERSTKNGGKQRRVTLGEGIENTPIGKAFGLCAGGEFFVFYGGSNRKAPTHKVCLKVDDDGPQSSEPEAPHPALDDDDVPF